MYNQFFGFSERPFKLLPNPAYLFLSRSHEEAMANLVYAVLQGDGFIKIVGEAGTGKTTICRSFIEKIKDDIEVAYIFNPKMDSLQLLKAINDEFKIDSDADNIKDLIDTLNVFLLNIMAEKKQAILLIDEAQNLSAEVLEQLRLLSNLETTIDKLLQIILVGQPELDDMLDEPGLRQLAQRITLSCYLKPLSHQETKAYIQHRIAIASQKSVVNFSRGAINYIYRFSRGIPRLINIASDRALLVGFCANRYKIDARIARTAIQELAIRGHRKNYDDLLGARPMLKISLLLTALFIFILYHLGVFNVSTSTITLHETSEPALILHRGLKSALSNPLPASNRQAAQASKVVKSDPVSKPTEYRQNSLNTTDIQLTKQEAVGAVLRLWGIEAALPQDIKIAEAKREFFGRAAERNGFSYLSIPNDMNLLKSLDLPCILECHMPGLEQPAFFVISALKGRLVTLQGEQKNTSLDIETAALKRHWSGSGHIFWKNFRGLRKSSPFRFSEQSVFILKAVLQEIGFDNIRYNPYYDIKTDNAVKQIQKKHGLVVDGIVGPYTMIVLHHEINSYKIPRITQHFTARKSDR